MGKKVIPILRIFDYDKAMEFYTGWLGFTIDWEHRFSENSPLYLQVSLDFITLHLTEHHGDCTPGAKVFIEFEGIRSYHERLTSHNYKYNKPGLEEAPWNALCMEVTDPFGNRLLFSEKKEEDLRNQ